MIDSKNVNNKQADAFIKQAFNKAFNQCKVFKSILEILLEATLNVNPFDKINFKMGAYIPDGLKSSINNDNCFIIDNKDFDDFDALKLKFSTCLLIRYSPNVLKGFLKNNKLLQ
jgi:hypothetical protein